MVGIRRKADPTNPVDSVYSWRRRLAKMTWEMQEFADFATNANHEGISEMTTAMMQQIKDAREGCIELERVLRLHHEGFRLPKAKTLDERAQEYHDRTRLELTGPAWDGGRKVAKGDADKEDDE
jgi:hypothetical protein